MKKADRLFQLVTLLQGRRVAMPAAELALALGVSLRTVYRDIQGLAQSGVMIDGAPGVGYLLRQQSHVPPLMFSAEEVLAMLVGSHMVQAFTDPELARAAQQAEHKIRAVLPGDLKLRAEQAPYRIPVLQKDTVMRQRHAFIRSACEQHNKLTLCYTDEAGASSHRVIWPLGIVGLHGLWMLLAWCELRGDYRTFRFDRVQSVELEGSPFVATPKVSMAHYFEQLLRGE